MQQELKRLLDEDRTARTSKATEIEVHAAEHHGERGSNGEQLALPVPEHDIDSEDREMEPISAQEQPRLIAGAAGPSRPVPLAELGNGVGEADGPEAIEPVPKADLGPSRSSPFAKEDADPVHEGIVADPDRFFDVSYATVLRRIILSIVEKKGPMPLHGLARRVAQEHGAADWKAHPGAGTQEPRFGGASLRVREDIRLGAWEPR